MMLFHLKRGQSTMLIFFMFIILLIGIVFLLVGGLITTKTYDMLNQNIEIGDVNLQNITADSFGQFHTMYINNADWWGMSIIIGMVLGLFVSAYMTRNTFPKWGIVLDIFIIIGAFLFALYLSSVYGELLDALAGADETFLEDYASKTSLFILNLPLFVVIIGVVAMFLFHSSIPKRTEEEYQTGGYLRGA